MHHFFFHFCIPASPKAVWVFFLFNSACARRRTRIPAFLTFISVCLSDVGMRTQRVPHSEIKQCNVFWYSRLMSGFKLLLRVGSTFVLMSTLGWRDKTLYCEKRKMGPLDRESSSFFDKGLDLLSTPLMPILLLRDELMVTKGWSATIGERRDFLMPRLRKLEMIAPFMKVDNTFSHLTPAAYLCQNKGIVVEHWTTLTKISSFQITLWWITVPK